MRIDVQLEIDDDGRTFIEAGGEWFYVYDDVVKDFLGWVMSCVVSE
jgi:hypothetical protein